VSSPPFYPSSSHLTNTIVGLTPPWDIVPVVSTPFFPCTPLPAPFSLFHRVSLFSPTPSLCGSVLWSDSHFPPPSPRAFIPGRFFFFFFVHLIRPVPFSGATFLEPKTGAYASFSKTLMVALYVDFIAGDPAFSAFFSHWREPDFALIFPLVFACAIFLVACDFPLFQAEQCVPFSFLPRRASPRAYSFFLSFCLSPSLLFV